jgi:glycosyltransferase involved in cell wall biosynthesis
LAKAYSQADVFVFPSKTDTYGLVIGESLGCGVPVAAYPAPGPIDIIQNGITGIINDDLEFACLEALKLNSKDCIEFARNNSWEKATEQFINNLIQAKR